MAYDVFISHSSMDKPIADSICANLESAGLRPWIAPRDIAPGEDWPTAIANAIANSRILVLVFTANSNASDDVSRELGLAAHRKVVILPFKLENIEPEPGKQYFLTRTHWLEGTNPPTQEQLTRLVQQVKTILPVNEPAAQVAPVPPAPREIAPQEESRKEGGRDAIHPKPARKKITWWAAGLGGLLILSLIATAVFAFPGSLFPPAPTQTAASSPTLSGSVTDLHGTVVTVAVENAYAPFSQIDPASGEGIGWDYDVLREICARLNCRPEFQQAAWDGIFEALAAGEYDILADGVTLTAERDQLVDFSLPYITIGQLLMVRASETRTLEQFKIDDTARIAAQAGSNSEIVAGETFPAARPVSFENSDRTVADLQSGMIDAIVMDNVSAANFFLSNADLKSAGQITSNEPLAFAFPPGSPLIAPFNAALQAMLADGTLTEIHTTWGLIP